jgi:hypothetical protein
MVKLTDAHAEALALVGTGTLTPAQIESVLDIFSRKPVIMDGRFYNTGTLDSVSLVVYAHVDNMLINICSTNAHTPETIDLITQNMLWSDLLKLEVELRVGHDDYDYTLSMNSKKKDVFASFFFRLSRTPYEIID